MAKRDKNQQHNPERNRQRHVQGGGRDFYRADSDWHTPSPDYGRGGGEYASAGENWPRGRGEDFGGQGFRDRNPGNEGWNRGSWQREGGSPSGGARFDSEWNQGGSGGYNRDFGRGGGYGRESSPRFGSREGMGAQPSYFSGGSHVYGSRDWNENTRGEFNEREDKNRYGYGSSNLGGGFGRTDFGRHNQGFGGREQNYGGAQSFRDRGFDLGSDPGDEYQGGPRGFERGGSNDFGDFNRRALSAGRLGGGSDERGPARFGSPEYHRSFRGVDFDDHSSSRQSGRSYGDDWIRGSARNLGRDYGEWDREDRNRQSESIGEKIGRFFGIGPKGWQRSDERIREEVSEALADHPEIDASEIEVQVSGGEVTLTGSAPDRRSKRLAEDVAEGVRGVKDVHNQIRVQSRQYGGGMGTTTGSTAVTGDPAGGAMGTGTSPNASKKGPDKDRAA